jgi:hypothetical protein
MRCFQSPMAVDTILSEEVLIYTDIGLSSCRRGLGLPYEVVGVRVSRQ